MRVAICYLGILTITSCTIDPPSCANLYKIASDPDRVGVLWGEVIEVLKKDPLSFVDKPVFPVHTMYAKDAKDGFGLDWNKWGIENDKATLGWKGVSVELEAGSVDPDHIRFSLDRLTYVGVGNSRRDILMFELREQGSSPEARLKLESYDISVMCTSMPRLLINQEKYKTLEQ